MGRRVAEVVAHRLGASLLELGGNNAVIVAPTANLDLAVRAILFGAVGTAGQRCTSTRRVLMHESIRAQFTTRLLEAYKQVRVGNPMKIDTLNGPLISPKAVQVMQQTRAPFARAGARFSTAANR